MPQSYTLHPDLAGNNALLASLGFDFVVQELIEVIREGLKRDGLVRLYQFGTFRLRYSKPRQYKHPKTGVTRTLPSAPRVTFKPAKHLRDQIQKNPAPIAAPAMQANTNIATAMPAELALENISPGEKKKKKYNLPLLGIAAVVLLAAIPFMLSVLQNDLQAPAENITPTPVAQVVASNLPATNKATPDIVVSYTTTNKIKVQPINNSQSNVSTSPDIVASNSIDANTFFLRPAIHLVSKGDSLWRLAAKHYNEPLYWPYIYRANQRVLSNPNKIDINMKLVIPGLQHPPGNLSVRDRQAIAQGYYLLYEYHTQNDDPLAKDYLFGAHHFDTSIVARRKEVIG